MTQLLAHLSLPVFLFVDFTNMNNISENEIQVCQNISALKTISINPGWGELYNLFVATL